MSGHTPNKFRAELVKAMPGYRWTVHKSDNPDFLEATGTQSSGFNRLSTLRVTRHENCPVAGSSWYEVKSAGYGKNEDATLARALRGLQNHYEQRAAKYASHAHAINNARAAISKATNTPLPASSPEQAGRAGTDNLLPSVPASNSPGPHVSVGSGGSRSNPSEDDVRVQKCGGARSPVAGRVRDAGQLVRQSSQAATNSEKG